MIIITMNKRNIIPTSKNENYPLTIVPSRAAAIMAWEHRIIIIIPPVPVVVAVLEAIVTVIVTATTTAIVGLCLTSTSLITHTHHTHESIVIVVHKTNFKVQSWKYK